MEKLFIHAKDNTKINLSKEATDILSAYKKIGLITTIQYLHNLGSVEPQLPNSVILGQILGCDASVIKRQKADAYLYIGTGRFHPIKVGLETKTPVFTYNPHSNQFRKITNKDIENMERKTKAGITNFLTSEKIGILVSTKEGQSRMKDAEALKTKLKKKGKVPYIIVFDTLINSFLESYNFIDCFVNTACPRIIEDDLPKKVVNIDDIIEFV